MPPEVRDAYRLRAEFFFANVSFQVRCDHILDPHGSRRYPGIEFAREFQMGFRIGVDKDVDTILTRMSTRPGEVFPKPYSGYLVFLAGAGDKFVLDWIVDNLVALDSLAGDSVAFCFFAKEFNFSVNIDSGGIYGGGPERRPKDLGTLMLGRFPGGSGLLSDWLSPVSLAGWVTKMKLQLSPTLPMKLQPV